jgi:hypothetical protein
VQRRVADALSDVPELMERAVERGLRKPSAEILQQIAKGLGQSSIF